jgi:hypothetical protein
MTQQVWHHGREHRPGGPDPIPARPVMHIKVFGDSQAVTTGDGKFVFACSEDMDRTALRTVEMYVTTVSSLGIVQVQLRNVTQAVDMLITRVQIDQGEKNSKDASTAYVIGDADVAWGDELAIDVDAAGTGARGLGVILEFA